MSNTDWYFVDAPKNFQQFPIRFSEGVFKCPDFSLIEQASLASILQTWFPDFIFHDIGKEGPIYLATCNTEKETLLFKLKHSDSLRSGTLRSI